MDFSQQELDAFRAMTVGNKTGQRVGLQTPQQPQKKKRNFWLDQISTAGGILGGIGGTLVAPVVGTAAGGAIGSGLGEAIENLIDPESGDMGNIFEEAALGGLFAGGPLKLGKAALGARGALATGKATGLKEAMKMGGKEASKFTLRGALGGTAQKKATQAATKQFGLTGNFLTKFSGKYGDDAGKVINQYGISSVDDAGKAITQQQGVFDDLVKGAGNVKKSSVQKQLYGISDDLSKQAPTAQKQLGQKLRGETDQFLSQFGDDIPATELNKFRRQYDDLVNYTLKQSNPAEYGLNKRMADGIRKTIQDAAGGDLKKTGMELSKLRTLEEEIGKRAATVAGRGTSPFGLRNLLGGAVGAGAGGPLGAAAGMGLTSAVNSPTGRRLAASAAQGTAKKLTEAGAKKASQSAARQVGTNLGGLALARNALSGGATPEQPQQDPSLGEVMATVPQIDPVTGLSMTPQTALGGAMAQQPQTGNPYSKQNLMADIQRDPANAEDYIQYYAMLDEVFNPVQEAPESPYGRPSAEKYALAQSGLGAISQLEQMLAADPGVLQRSATPGQNLPVIGGLIRRGAGTGEYEATAQNILDTIARARTGAAMTEAEEAFYRRMLPQPGESPAAVQNKLQLLRGALQPFTGYTGGAPVTPNPYEAY